MPCFSPSIVLADGGTPAVVTLSPDLPVRADAAAPGVHAPAFASAMRAFRLRLRRPSPLLPSPLRLLLLPTQIADAQSETLLAGVELARVLADAEAFDESGEVDEEPTLERTSLLSSSENVRERRERDALVSNSLEDPWSGSDGVMLRVQATVRHVRDRGTFVNVDI